jgi:hypothetical protein
MSSYTPQFTAAMVLGTLAVIYLLFVLPAREKATRRKQERILRSMLDDTESSKDLLLRLFPLTPERAEADVDDAIRVSMEGTV